MGAYGKYVIIAHVIIQLHRNSGMERKLVPKRIIRNEIRRIPDQRLYSHATGTLEDVLYCLAALCIPLNPLTCPLAINALSFT